MKILILLVINIGILGCAVEDQQDVEESQSWSIDEPQIVNSKGKIFLTNIQHQSKQALSLTDALVFNNKHELKDIKFITTTRCYDQNQKELIEKKSFSFKEKVSIQKLMPKESFHPKYIINEVTLNCTFKFRLENKNGSSHNFRLYSQQVKITDQEQDKLIELTHNTKNKLQIININNLHKENFLLPNKEIKNLELVCQSFRLKYLSHIELMSPFYGFNTNSITKDTYPREICRIIGEHKANYILSKPFQIQFSELKNPMTVSVPSNKYNKNSKSIKVINLHLSNSNSFSVSYKIQFPEQIWINKFGTNYKKPFQIEFRDTKKIKKENNKYFKVYLQPNDSVEFYIYTDLSKTCFHKMSMGLGQIVILDQKTDIYFKPETIKIYSNQHDKFYYQKQFINSKYISSSLVRSDINHAFLKKQTRSNKLNKNYSPNINNGCKNTPPRVQSVSGQIRIF